MMIYNDLVHTMLEKIPELRLAYEEEMQWLEEEQPHVIFSMVLNPYLFEMLRSVVDTAGNAVLVRIFTFLEEMANSNVEAIQEVLVVTVLESLVLERDIVTKARALMGPVTTAFLEEQEKTFGWSQ